MERFGVFLMFLEAVEVFEGFGGFGFCWTFFGGGVVLEHLWQFVCLFEGVVGFGVFGFLGFGGFGLFWCVLQFWGVIFLVAGAVATMPRHGGAMVAQPVSCATMAPRSVP